MKGATNMISQNTLFPLVLAIGLVACGGDNFTQSENPIPPLTDANPPADSEIDTNSQFDSDSPDTVVPPPDGCIPQLCPSDKCGVISDECGGFVQCELICSGYDTCGGGGTPNECGCTPQTQEQACGTNKCGMVEDGCGGEIDCGGCSVLQECRDGTCYGCEEVTLNPNPCSSDVNNNSWACPKDKVLSAEVGGCRPICVDDRGLAIAKDLFCCSFNQSSTVVGTQPDPPYCPPDVSLLGRAQTGQCNCYGVIYNNSTTTITGCNSEDIMCSPVIKSLYCGTNEHTGACF
jgi:hypothetical protein